MAKKVVYVDDFDDTEIDENLGGGPVEFSLDGKFFTIDLNVKNKDKLRKALEPYIEKATEVEGPKRRGRPRGSGRKPSGSGRSSEELAAIRHWLTQNGYEVSERGRIKQELIEIFDAAHSPSSE